MPERFAVAPVIVALVALAAPLPCLSQDEAPPTTLEAFRRLSVEDPRGSLAQGEMVLRSRWAEAHPEWSREVLLRMARAASLLADEPALESAIGSLEALGSRDGDVVASAYAKFLRASTWAESGRVSEALDIATEAAATLSAGGDPKLTAIAASELCDVVGRAGRSDLAAEHCAAARRLWADLGDQYQLARVDNYLSMVARDQGRTDEAIRIAKLARAEFLEVGLPSLATMMDDNLAGMYLDKGDGATALALSEGSLRHELAAGKTQHAVLSRMNIARALAMLGRYDEARSMIATAISEARRIGYETGLPTLFEAQLEVAVAAGDTGLIADAAREAVAVTNRLATSEREKAIAEMQERYLALEKQRQIDRLAHEKRVGELQLEAANEMLARQRLGIVLVAVAGTSVAVVAILLLQLLRAGKRRERELHVLSRTDPLTGTVTRRAFIEAVTRVLREDRSAALLVIDVDHFKQLNDSHGHLAGDQALQSLVARVRAQIRAGDVLARLGGEEFGVVLPEIGADEALRRAEAIRSAIAVAPHLLGDVTARVTVSIGVSVLEPGLRPSVEQWLGAADEALYEAKRAGRDRVAEVRLHGSGTA